MSARGFLLTPDGGAWIDVDLVGAVIYDGGASGEVHGASVCLGTGRHVIPLGEWATEQGREVAVGEWLLGVVMVRTGHGDQAQALLGDGCGVVWTDERPVE